MRSRSFRTDVGLLSPGLSMNHIRSDERRRSNLPPMDRALACSELPSKKTGQLRKTPTEFLQLDRSRWKQCLACSSTGFPVPLLASRSYPVSWTGTTKEIGRARAHEDDDGHVGRRRMKAKCQNLEKKTLGSHSWRMFEMSVSDMFLYQTLLTQTSPPISPHIHHTYHRSQNRTGVILDVQPCRGTVRAIGHLIDDGNGTGSCKIRIFAERSRSAEGALRIIPDHALCQNSKGLDYVGQHRGDCR